MSTDKTFYTIQNKAIEQIHSTVEHYELQTISSETAMNQIKETLDEMNDNMMSAVAQVKGER